MSQATYDDVNLILRLYELRREEKLRAARAWFIGTFKCKTMAEYNQLCPPGSETNAMARMVTSYWDMAASFAAAGVLNEDLLFQSARELLIVYYRVLPILEEVRTTFKDPNYMRNLEQVGKSYTAWLERQNPETVAAFKARIGS